MRASAATRWYANNLTTDGMTVIQFGAGDMNVAITNNTFDYAGSQRGILIQAGRTATVWVMRSVPPSGVR